MRTSNLKRETKETKINLKINLDGKGESEIHTGIGFFDHMLTLLSRHSGMDMIVDCKGDLDVDFHHTVEDVGIVIGKAISEALGEKRGIRRYGNFKVPMDEALSSVDLDISGRPYLVFNVKMKSQKTGDFDTCLVEEFFRALTHNASITLHINCEYGTNDHHIIEGIFKGFALALRRACEQDPRFAEQIPSTKGLL